MLKEILILGIGGEGVQLTGNFILNATLKKNYNLSFYPIYGSQMRGGESTLVIKISDKEIINPLPSKPDIVAIMNGTHRYKYKDFCKKTNIIDMSKDNILKNKNIKLLAKIVKQLDFIKKEDIYILFKDKFKDDKKYNNIKNIFDVEYDK